MKPAILSSVALHQSIIDLIAQFAVDSPETYLAFCRVCSHFRYALRNEDWKSRFVRFHLQVKNKIVTTLSVLPNGDYHGLIIVKYPKMSLYQVYNTGKLVKSVSSSACSKIINAGKLELEFVIRTGQTVKFTPQGIFIEGEKKTEKYYDDLVKGSIPRNL